jgi:hypothetical protein
MAALGTTVVERRTAPRVAPAQTRWLANAVLRPGMPVVLVNISRRGALVESGARLRPGAQTELQLAGASARTSVRGRVDRCHVTGLDPLRYCGAIVFDEGLDLDGGLGAEDG